MGGEGGGVPVGGAGAPRGLRAAWLMSVISLVGLQLLTALPQSPRSQRYRWTTSRSHLGHYPHLPSVCHPKIRLGRQEVPPPLCGSHLNTSCGRWGSQVAACHRFLLRTHSYRPPLALQQVDGGVRPGPGWSQVPRLGHTHVSAPLPPGSAHPTPVTDTQACGLSRDARCGVPAPLFDL